MKKYLIMPVVLLCTACVSVATLTQEAQEFANNLETEKDPIQVIDAYRTYKGLCRWGWNQKVPPQEECIKRDALAEQGMDFGCVGLPTSYSGNKKYDSDECILYRRSEKFHESEVSYFDYKRFLGEGSVIKTDEDFLKLVKLYDNISECDNMQEATTIEKEACKEKRKNEIRELAKRKVPCSELIKDKYTEKLKDTGDWYRWAINHDPNEYVRLYRALGEYAAANWVYAPVWSRAKARQEVKERIINFGKENFCTTDDWAAEIKKLGFNL